MKKNTIFLINKFLFIGKNLHTFEGESYKNEKRGWNSQVSPKKEAFRRDNSDDIGQKFLDRFPIISYSRKAALGYNFSSCHNIQLDYIRWDDRFKY